MAVLHPFRALRPSPGRAAAVSSVPYDVVSSAEVYAKARENFSRLREQAPLLVDEAPALYCYRLRMGGHEGVGLAGCFAIDEYEQDVIKKHERTRRDKEDDRTRHII